MTRTTIAWIALAFVGGALAALAVRHLAGAGEPSLTLMIGAILAAFAAAWRHSIIRTQFPTWRFKFKAGAVTSVTCFVYASTLQAITGWMPFPEISIPISAAGALFFPFIVPASIHAAFLEMRRKAERPTD